MSFRAISRFTLALAALGLAACGSWVEGLSRIPRPSLPSIPWISQPGTPVPERPAARSSPTSEAAFEFMVARLAEGQNDLATAAQHYERVLRIDAGAEEASRRLVDVYARLGQPDLALVHARRILEAESEGEPDAEIRNKASALFEWVARSRAEGGDLAGALEALRQKLERFPGDLSALEGMIRLQGQAGDDAAVVASLEERARFHPENPLAQFQLGFAYVELERYADAIAVLEPVLEGEPSEELEPLLGRVHFVLARAYGGSDQLARALRSLRAIESGDEFHERALREEARLLEGAGRRREAIRRLRRAVRDREFSALHVTLAELLERAGQSEQAIELVRGALGSGDGGGRARLLLAELLRDADRGDEAAEVLRAVRRGDSAFLEARIELAQILESEGQLSGAIAEIESVLLEQPGAVQLQVYLANLKRRAGDLGGATELLESVVERSGASPQGDRARYALGRFYQEAGDDERALAVLQEIEKGTAVHSESRIVLAQLFEERGEYARAIAQVEGVLSERPGAIELHLYLAGLLQRSGELTEAIERLEALRSALEPAPARLLYVLGRMYADDARIEAAEQTLAEIGRDDPVYADARIAMAQLLDEQGRSDEALDVLRAAIELRPDVIELQVYLAEVNQRAGDLDRAISIMDALIREHPERGSDLRYRKGVIYGLAGDVDRALEIMEEELGGEGRDDPRILNYVGYTWADRGERLAEAEAMIRRAVQLEPDDGAIADSLGWVLYRRGMALRERGEEARASELLRESLRALERAARLDPEDPVILRHVAEAYHSLDRFDEALSIYRRALANEPDEAEASEIRSSIEAIEAQLRGDRSGDSR